MPERPLRLLSGVGQAEMDAYAKKYPAPVMTWQQFCPPRAILGKSWKTLSNKLRPANTAADPVALGSSAPIKSRGGVETVSGELMTFKTGWLKDETEIEEFRELTQRASQFNNPDQFRQILEWIGEDVMSCRTAALSQGCYLTWALLSSACNLALVAANSPYLSALKNIAYPVESWQKDVVGTAWSDPAADILDDIKGVLDVLKTHGKRATRLKVNEKEFGYIQQNTQVQKYCATYVQNFLNLEGIPTLSMINSMLSNYFRTEALVIEVIDEIVTREAVDGTTTTANPFADGVGVFTVESRVGSFQYSMLSSRPGVVSLQENYYNIERLYQSDPDIEKTLVKFNAMPVIDSYADNFYLKINAVAWA